jgi:hypothetical protein
MQSSRMIRLLSRSIFVRTEDKKGVTKSSFGGSFERMEHIILRSKFCSKYIRTKHANVCETLNIVRTNLNLFEQELRHFT